MTSSDGPRFFDVSGEFERGARRASDHTSRVDDGFRRAAVAGLRHKRLQAVVEESATARAAGRKGVPWCSRFELTRRLGFRLSWDRQCCVANRFKQPQSVVPTNTGFTGSGLVAAKSSRKMFQALKHARIRAFEFKNWESGADDEDVVDSSNWQHTQQFDH